MPVKTISIEEFVKIAVERFGSDRNKWVFVCPACKTPQTGEDLIKAGVKPEDVNSVMAYSCIGRFTNAGPVKKGDKPGKGCDWTLGGLFHLHTLEVIYEDGYKRPVFEFAEV
jgi:hypothetical protein